MISEIKFKTKLPISSHHIALFIAHLHTNKLQISTIGTYMSAISFVHKMQGHQDNTFSFIVHKALKGVEKLKVNTTTSLLPITKHILNSLLDAIPYATTDNYSRHMYKALFLLCFHACLRAGEVVHSNKSTHTLQKHQVVKTKSGYKINFHSYKHSSGRTPTMQLEASNAKYCAVKELRAFLKLRGNVCGALFTKHNEKPLSRQEFSRFLRDCLELQGDPSASYNTHSFRIGRATQLSMDNATDAVISSTGRWKSAAFKQYIRPAYFTLPKWNLSS